MTNKKFKNRKNQNRSNKQMNPSVQMSKQINLYSEKTYRNITLPVTVVLGVALSGLYSFTPAVDTRFIAFTAVLASSEFTNLALVYQNYRIINASSFGTMTSYGVVAGSLDPPILHMNVEVAETPANPTNSQVILDDTSKIFNPKATVIESVKWVFSGTGITTHIWSDVAISPTVGMFTIGNNITKPAAIDMGIWDFRLQLGIEFANPI